MTREMTHLEPGNLIETNCLVANGHYDLVFNHTLDSINKSLIEKASGSTQAMLYNTMAQSVPR